MIFPECGLAITGWGVLSPIGIDRASFVSGFHEKVRGARPAPAGAGGPLPYAEVFHIPEFDTAKALGSKGTRSMDRTTGMAVATVGMALEHSGVDVAAAAGRIGVVLGTSTGSIKSITDFTRDTWVQDRPYLVNPAHFPNTVMNCAAGHCAIWHKLRGINATISGGHASAVLALNYASLAIRRGYADTLLVGGVEEFCEQSAWGHFRTGGTDGDNAPGEGCAVFVVERGELASASGRKVIAEVLACELAIYPPDEQAGGDSQADGLARCIRRALGKNGLDPADVGAVSPCHRSEPGLRAVEDSAIRQVFGSGEPPELLRMSGMVGDCFSASAALQMAGLLGWLSLAPQDRPGYGLLTSITREGTVGCVLLRGPGEGS